MGRRTKRRCSAPCHVNTVLPSAGPQTHNGTCITAKMGLPCFEWIDCQPFTPGNDSTPLTRHSGKKSSLVDSVPLPSLTIALSRMAKMHLICDPLLDKVFRSGPSGVPRGMRHQCELQFEIPLHASLMAAALMTGAGWGGWG
eukprot:CAMPEP_0174330486 /NCGR_PEP_ID=MMETSP0810-20121108/16720_1 /TAXON_ID=73025 ORGANISM="Eutreptiella gymnastica-like, Strain CCMP1594" /NCGR_SAMPLE_ID=MMETSP0810 /ASSEMBLY_ACC=CAM_ASM_000659 /LENGTH=141 /DNA_ID=CAMNT_0015445691 /DNA_START=380 /DNA_END=801 /DNA_ORIENTATION=-